MVSFGRFRPLSDPTRFSEARWGSDGVEAEWEERPSYAGRSPDADACDRISACPRGEAMTDFAVATHLGQIADVVSKSR